MPPLLHRSHPNTSNPPPLKSCGIFPGVQNHLTPLPREPPTHTHNPHSFILFKTMPATVRGCWLPHVTPSPAGVVSPSPPRATWRTPPPPRRSGVPASDVISLPGLRIPGILPRHLAMATAATAAASYARAARRARPKGRCPPIPPQPPLTPSSAWRSPLVRVFGVGLGMFWVVSSPFFKKNLFFYFFLFSTAQIHPTPTPSTHRG